MKNQSKVEHPSERETLVSCTINGPLHLVFEAWTKAELFRHWWGPKSFPAKLLSCEIDARTGGSYRLVFDFNSQEMVFFGTYREVSLNTRLVWTNDEGGPEAAATTTVTFEGKGEQTLVRVHDLHPSKEALEASGSSDALPEQFEQLEEMIASIREARLGAEQQGR